MSGEDPDWKPRESLQMVLDALRKLAEARKPPTRHEARELLLSLGNEIRSGNSGDVDRAIESLRLIVPAFGGKWPAAVADELTMACTEHVRSVEPRYLDHPRYDFEYTIEARERLELRLLAAQKMALPASPELMAQVARADALLTASLDRRSKREHKPS